jgi:hypothetical protein
MVPPFALEATGCAAETTVTRTDMEPEREAARHGRGQPPDPWLLHHREPNEVHVGAGGDPGHIKG